MIRRTFPLDGFDGCGGSAVRRIPCAEDKARTSKPMISPKQFSKPNLGYISVAKADAQKRIAVWQLTVCG